MGLTYEQAGPEVHQLAREIFERHHPELRMAGATTDPAEMYPRLCIMLVARDDDSEECPLKKDGRDLVGRISVIPLKQRADKRADAEVLVYAKWWEAATEPQRRASLDRWITYLQIEKDENGYVVTDDVSRPKLKLRQPDWHIEGFRSIAERYGGDALEVREARAFEDAFGACVLKQNLFA